VRCSTRVYAVEGYLLEMKRKTRYFVQTFGCQMNVNDSEKLAGLLVSRGHEPVAELTNADFVFINTCAVREKAARKLQHSLARLRREKERRPEMRIGVGGCVAQLEGSVILERARQVDILVGTHNLHRVPDLLAKAEQSGAPAVDLDRSADPFSIPGRVVAHGNPVRAYVTAMEGCNHVCSFCVVPRTRGTEINRPADDIVREIESLVAGGFPEIMLLGQTVNAYQHDGIDFAGLLARTDRVRGLKRLRFTTSHPVHVNERMVEALSSLGHLCPYLHLPVQSGSDRVLASMRRGHTARQYLDTVALLRDRVPDLALSTDVIVGYPGETEGEFEETLALLEAVGFDSLFSFAYSPRPGTSAVRLADDVPAEEKGRRLRVVNEHQQRRQRRNHAARIGSREEVLVETVDGPGRLSGRTPHFRIVHFDGGEGLVGRIVEVEVTGAGPNALLGRLTQPIH
jgi:tRNA-2-methylthio-N6-dimethylallyladenosine synthase